MDNESKAYYINGEIIYSPKFIKGRECAEKIYCTLDANESKEVIYQQIKEIGEKEHCLFDVFYIHNAPEIVDHKTIEVIELLKKNEVDKAIQYANDKIEIDVEQKNIRIRSEKYNFLYSFDRLDRIRYKNRYITL